MERERDREKSDEANLNSKRRRQPSRKISMTHIHDEMTNFVNMIMVLSKTETTIIFDLFFQMYVLISPLTTIDRTQI